MLNDFIRRSLRSAKIARCARCSDCDFRRSPRSAYKIADIWHVRYRRLNSPAFAKCARSRYGFYGHRCELPVKSINQVGRFYHMNNVESATSIGGENCLRFRWRSNWPRSAYKIARCVAGVQTTKFSHLSTMYTDIPDRLSKPLFWIVHW